MGRVRQPSPWMAGLGLLALVLLLTWVSAGPYVNLFAPFDEEAVGVGGAVGSYERYQGLPDEIRRSGGGSGIWLVVLAVVLGAVLVLMAVRLLPRLSFKAPTAQRSAPAAAAADPAGGQPSASSSPDRVLSDVLSALSSGASPRDSIVGGWRELEEALMTTTGALPVNRTPDDVTVLLIELTGDRTRSLEFERLYLQARYGAGEVDEATRQQATQLVRDLRHQLTTDPAGTSP